MRKLTLTAVLVATGLTLGACSDAGVEEAVEKTTTAEGVVTGGEAPVGVMNDTDPDYPLETEVFITEDLIPGLEGSLAEVVGAYNTTAYKVSYMPSVGEDPVKNYRWVIHEELEDPGDDTIANGTSVVLKADHLEGMKGATATVEDSTDETVYMVNILDGEHEMENYKWVTESDIKQAH